MHVGFGFYFHFTCESFGYWNVSNT